MMFLFAGGIILFLNSYQKRILSNQLKMQEMEVKHQQELFYGNLESMENERKRISRDLHDEVGAALSTTRLIVCQIQEKDTDDAQTLTEECKKMIDKTMDNIRRISNDMLPHGLEEFGLEYAIEELCDKVMMASDIDIDFDSEDYHGVNKKAELVIYRIVQELLNNSLKHARATEINIGIQKPDEEEDYLITYQDNGIGFEYPVPRKKAGLGIMNIENRVKMIFGSMKLFTQPQQGFRIEIKVPVSILLQNEN
ncbi:sensor histidine kinase [Pseudarcicella hirudinis]|nr:sensor histidine kinase [Pseudarcicella hirudinis]